MLTGGDPGKEWAASPCVNPVVDRWWDFRGHRYHVKGLHKSVEEIKERNGPFAGKRVSRPVANYEACHGVVLNVVQKTLGNNFDPVIKVGSDSHQISLIMIDLAGAEEEEGLHEREALYQVCGERPDRSFQRWKREVEIIHGLTETCMQGKANTVGRSF